jgi:hypothetical protein
MKARSARRRWQPYPYGGHVRDLDSNKFAAYYFQPV